MATGTRERAIEAAAELFQRQGYAATGVTEIIERSGTPKGSFYFHFPGGKEELAVAALTQAGGRLGEAIAQLAAPGAEPAAFVRTLGDVLAAGLEQSEFERGCPLATVVPETAATSEGLRASANAGFAGWEAAIATGLAAGEPVTAEDEDLATVVLAGLEGALVLARARRDAGVIRQTAARLAALAG